MNIKQKIPQRSYTGEMWRSMKANKQRLVVDFDKRCAYCDDLDKYAGGSKMYHVDHFAPKEKFPELEYTYDNLLYSCPFCNISKSNKWPSDDSTVNIVGNIGFVNPCMKEYSNHLVREKDGSINYVTDLGEYMYYELKLYLRRHQLIYNLSKVHLKLKELSSEIKKRKQLQKPVDKLEIMYKELCVVFYEYYDVFSEET